MPKILIALIAVIALGATAYLSFKSRLSPPLQPPAANTSTNRKGAVTSGLRIEPIKTAGGKVVSVASGSFKILTLNYINPSSDKPGETQEREIVTNASTKIYLLQETSAKKLKRVATSFADIKAGASVNVQTAGSFTEPGKVTATQVDIFPAGGTPFLPIE